jgi:predicted AlkP superfamily phosphohydrolase/phosphomutase
MLDRKVFVIGLDGATFSLIKPWADKGHLPCLKSLMGRGVHGVLLSTPEPSSAQAWSSFMTGKNPGKHGLYYFVERQPGSYDLRLTNGNAREGRAVWGIVGDAGGKVITVNVPMTYPPEEVNGILISGMDAPGTKCQFVHPPELAQELEEAVGGYVIESNVSSLVRQNRKEEAILELKNSIDKRFKAVQYLMKRHPWSLFTVVFVGIDRVQHHFWKYMDSSYPYVKKEEARKYGSTILDMYKYMDGLVGRLMDELDEDTNIIIVSDHGAGASSNRSVYLNKWLQEEGFLSFKVRDKGPLLSGYYRLKSRILWRGKYWSRKFLPRGFKEAAKRTFPRLADRVKAPTLPSLIDWSHTRAYARETTPSIWINLRGREPEGTVTAGKEYHDVRDAVVERLMALKDPETGENVVARVIKKEEVYSGKHSDEAPDLLIQWNENRYIQRPSHSARGDQPIEIMGPRELEEAERATRPSGIHVPEGIFLAQGEGFQVGVEIPAQSIYDVAPTILYLYDLPIPEDMDGTVIESALQPDLLAQRPVRMGQDEGADAKTESDIYSASEEEEITDRLKGLGYL